MQYKGERYEADMPWKPDVPELVNNFAMAVSPLRSAEERLLNDTQKYIEIYGDVINDYKQKGCVSKETPSKPQEKAWYLPLFVGPET